MIYTNFVPYEQALRLKELGFDELCLKEYHNQKLLPAFNSDLSNNSTLDQFFDSVISAPLISQAFKFFEDKFQAYASIVIDKTTVPKYAFEIDQFVGNDLSISEWYWKPQILSENVYRTRPEAEIECINQLIKIYEI
jgi:hypothetical protein